MGQVLVANGLPSTAVVQVGGVARQISFADHLTLLRHLLEMADGCLFEAPFLYQDFTELFAGLALRSQQLELITSLKARGNDQLRKPYALKSFGTLAREATGQWPLVHVNSNLHSKIYLFWRDGVPFAGVVTSANLTHSGLCTSHETGLLLDDVVQLRALEELAREGLQFHLTEQQIEKMSWWADEYQKRVGGYDGDIDAGLEGFLNSYATPVAGNHDIVLNSNARYFIKVSGTKENPILPAARAARSDLQSQLDFTRSTRNKVSIGDCLLEVAVGGMCFLSYYACASQCFERTEAEKAADDEYVRWPFYVYGNNLSLHYGQLWFEAPLAYEEIAAEFTRLHPQIAVTQAGGDSIKNAVQRGNSYFEVTREFGEFVRAKIDAFQLPRTDPAG